MRVRYIYSACVVIETPDLKICCAPWFTAGIYDGSWQMFPPLKRDPVDLIGPVDAIYVSHIHPDHYDPRFLSRYLARYPKTRLWIGETKPCLLEHKMKLDGFKPAVITRRKEGGTDVLIAPNLVHEADNIDTGLTVAHGGFSVVNLNDNAYDQKQVESLLSACPGGRPTLALLPYCGAGPYPQCYEFESPTALAAAAQAKRERYYELYSTYVRALRPAKAVPFAGKFVLGGPLSALNECRGAGDPVDLLSREPEVTVVLADGGEASIDLDTLRATGVRVEPYRVEDIRTWLDSRPWEGYDYERELRPLEGRSLPLIPLLTGAYANAVKKMPTRESCWICLKLPDGRWAAMDSGRDSGVKLLPDVSALTPRWEITVDPRYLFGLLTRLYHWNNAEIGSHLRIRRVPDIYKEEIPYFLYRLQA